MFSAAEKLKIMYALGYPAKTIKSGTTDYSRIISDRLDNQETETEDRVRGLLNQVDSLDTKLQEASSRFLAQSVGDIKLNPNESRLLKKERARVIKELGQILDLMPRGGGLAIGVRV